MHEYAPLRWLQITYKVPSEPSQKRVWVWRRLQSLGAYSLQNSVYILPSSEDAERHFRQLAREIRDMGGEASIFSIIALEAADEQRILQRLLDVRHSEYNTIMDTCRHFLGRTTSLVAEQEWDEQTYAECAKELEKVHVLFRTAKRRDLLGPLTATRRALAAESLALCEQIFRVVFEKDYAKARRLLDLHRDLLHTLDTLEPSRAQARRTQRGGEGEASSPEKA